MQYILHVMRQSRKGNDFMGKQRTLIDGISLIRDGDKVALGGNVLHRAPMAAVREMIRQEKKHLQIIKTAGAMDVDMLCLGDCVDSVDAGFISYETKYSLATHYRLGVQSGTIKGNEHACYTVISALRAAAYGVGFMPVKGLQISDLIEANAYFKQIADPFSGESITVVQALKPDVAVIHVTEADELGNAYIEGPCFEDVLLTRAADKVIVTTEKMIPLGKYSHGKQKAQIPHFLVDAVIHAPRGAKPCSCLPAYDIDQKDLDTFKQVANKEALQNYLASYEKSDQRKQVMQR